jgi:hypothetical protein
MTKRGLYVFTPPGFSWPEIYDEAHREGCSEEGVEENQTSMVFPNPSL